MTTRWAKTLSMLVRPPARDCQLDNCAALGLGLALLAYIADRGIR
ncbi:MAG: hypothetical protein WBQ34_09925 [Candidatus Acidiferrales bacterium]